MKPIIEPGWQLELIWFSNVFGSPRYVVQEDKDPVCNNHQVVYIYICIYSTKEKLDKTPKTSVAFNQIIIESMEVLHENSLGNEGLINRPRWHVVRMTNIPFSIAMATSMCWELWALLTLTLVILVSFDRNKKLSYGAWPHLFSIIYDELIKTPLIHLISYWLIHVHLINWSNGWPFMHHTSHNRHTLVLDCLNWCIFYDQSLCF